VNLAIEYLIRTGLIKEFLDESASIFLVGPRDYRLAVVVEKTEYKYLIRHWLLSEATPKYALPPMNDSISRDPFADLSRLKSVYSPLEYKEAQFPSRYSAPMEQAQYDQYTENICCSKEHVESKRRWLWNLFVSLYVPEVKKSITEFHFGYFSTSSELVMSRQQHVVQYDFPEVWKQWLMWEEHILIPNKPPGELIFSSSFSDDS
jgi:hypothetical protein